MFLLEKYQNLNNYMQKIIPTFMRSPIFEDTNDRRQIYVVEIANLLT